MSRLCLTRLPPQSLCTFPHPTSSSIPVCGSPCPFSLRTPSPYSKVSTEHFVQCCCPYPQQPGSCKSPRAGVTRSASAHRTPPQRQHTGMATALPAWPRSIPAPGDSHVHMLQGHSASTLFNMNTKPEVALRGQSISELTLGHLYVCVIFFSLFFHWK